MIDVNKPVRLSNGSKATYVEGTKGTNGRGRASAKFKIHGPHKPNAIHENQTWAYYLDDGTWVGEPAYPRLEQCVDFSVGDRLEHERLYPIEIAAITENSLFTTSTRSKSVRRIDRVTMTDNFGNVWTPAAEPSDGTTVEFINVYLEDFTRGAAHGSMEAAIDETQAGKTRIGIIERVRRGPSVTAAKVHSTTASRRDRRGGLTYNPYA